MKYVAAIGLCLLYTSTVLSGPLDAPIGTWSAFIYSLNNYEDDGGHTISKHIGKNYSYLSNRCQTENSSSIYSTFENSSIAYTEISRNFRHHESSIYWGPYLNSSTNDRRYYSRTNPTGNKFGKLIRCSLSSGINRWVDYYFSGTKKSTMQIFSSGSRKIILNSSYPDY